MKGKALVRIALIGILMLGFSVVALDKKSSENDRGYLVKVGDEAPAFVLHLSNGETVRSSDLKGKIVMLQFTASWCSVCRKEMPFIEKDIWQKHKDKSDFALFAVDRDEPLEKAQDLVKGTGITYPIALDENADVFALFADPQAGVTRNVIIGKDGRIKYLTRLFNKEEFDLMVSEIDQLLGE